jgi:hypothetical protein
LGFVKRFERVAEEIERRSIESTKRKIKRN